MKSDRIVSIDILRGLVMVLMALDHVRDYFHINAFAGNFPENMDSTTPILFFTRIITHFCAPVFVFLAGTSAFLYGQNKSKKQLTKFLITRGLWLIVVEITINNLLWWFDITYGLINLQVIWAIGCSMICLGFAIYLPKKVLIALGLLIVFGHNLLDRIVLEGQSPLNILWYILHQSNGISIGENRFLYFSYPILPWIGVMLLGYAFGTFYRKGFNEAIRHKYLIYIGLSATLLFFILRGINIYGDLAPWANQETVSKTVISFFKITKYPPSLVFVLMTLGPAFLFLYAVEKTKLRFASLFITFGRVPFFYYILHILVIHLGAIIGLLLTGKDWKLMILDNVTMNSGILKGYGYPLWAVYVIWIAIVLLLYPICKWYMNYKKANKDKWWLGYL